MGDGNAWLRQIPVFGGLADDELDKVIALSTTVEAAANALVVREGDLAKELFVIREGEAEVVIGLGEERERSLARLGVGDCFGEMSLIDIQPRSASVRALEDSVLLSLSHRAFRELSHWNLKTYTLIILNLAREISRRLRHAHALLPEFSTAVDHGWIEDEREG